MYKENTMKRKSQDILSLARRGILLLALPMVIAATGCQKKQAADSQHGTVTITSLNGSRDSMYSLLQMASPL